ncbi:DUF6465 family protein [Lacrimispora sp. 210928-DFI.3.58]|uniref:DUF6465 family protein n=1 Tax=Lacrimispora sp. 210928-DFI.3.58 TaxID=2883214 RepID=UPI001D089F35|nr:DUF6465 family protein [Lacrimispora sp. 210928-DFI.3.58]MCB7319525.1 DUF6465 family protein [Lacrimispora sp. 210928-DFI.3.58]
MTEVKKEAEAVVQAEVKAAAPVEKETKTAKKTTAKKTTAKKAAEPKEAAEKKPAARKTTAKKAAEPKEAAEKKPAAKKAAEPKAAAEKKPAAKRTTAKKAAEPKAAVHFQFEGKDIVARDVLDKAVKAYQEAHEGAEVKEIELYIVASEGAAYYVVNGEASDDYKIIL